jgi:predicted house-cleaning NTP pyrophosphatase (Maf/HAM1 superfamily)
MVQNEGDCVPVGAGIADKDSLQWLSDQTLLASGNPVKLGLLKDLGIDVLSICTAGDLIDERSHEADLATVNSPGDVAVIAEYPEHLAFSKARVVVAEFHNARVIGNDVGKIVGGHLLHKADTVSEAIAAILRQSGQTAIQVAGDAFYDPRRGWFKASVRTTMPMKTFSRSTVVNYVTEHTTDVLRVAGGMPILDGDAFGTFYHQDEGLLSVAKCFNQVGQLVFEQQAVLDPQDHLAVARAVYGFSQPLMEFMGLVGA